MNEKAFREVMEFNIRAGVHGFWIAGGTGESVLLDDDENMRISEIAADQGQGRVNNIMHVGAPTTKRAARMAEHAAASGVDAICCVPPFFYRPTDEALVEHYRVVASAAQLPLFVYNLPGATGVEITPERMRKIQDGVPQLKGLKHSAPSVAHIHTFAKMGLDCLIGSSALMLSGLVIGATGCVDGPPNLAPELWVEIWNAYRDGDLERAIGAQEKAREVVEAVRIYDYFASMKVAIGARLGIDCGAPRPPGLPLSEAQRSDLLRRTAKLGLTKRD